MADETVTVNRADLADTLYFARWHAENGVTSGMARRQAIERIARLEAEIAPPWEPSGEQVEAAWQGWDEPRPTNREFVVAWLKQAHAAGLVLP